MRRLYVLPVLVAAFANAASAQTIVFKPNERSISPAAPEQVHISVGVNMFVPAVSDNSEQSLKAQEDARRMIYELAGRECTILLDVIASECKLDSVNINVQRQFPNQNFGQQKIDGFNMNGSVSFRIVTK